MRESPAHNTDQAVIVALGSNLPGDYGSTQALLEAAVAALEAGGFKVLRRSRWWRSAAWPDPMQPEYRNGVAIVEADFPARKVLTCLLELETALDRERASRNAARTLDLDLIACGRAVVDEAGLTLPHPRAHQRLFVMGPLAEIAPGWTHPVTGETAAALAKTAVVGRDAVPT